MTKKKLAIAEIIIYICTFILLFSKNMYLNYVDNIFHQALSFWNLPCWVYIRVTLERLFHGVYYATTTTLIIGIVLIVLIIVSVIFLLIYCLRKTPQQDRKVWITLPILSTATYLLFSVHTMLSFRNSYAELRGGPIFYIEFALFFLALGVSCYRCFSNLPYVITIEESKINYFEPVMHSADELKKYKDLLDQGIITQEEFDAKKKQLLGL